MVVTIKYLPRLDSWASNQSYCLEETTTVFGSPLQPLWQSLLNRDDRAGRTLSTCARRELKSAQISMERKATTRNMYVSQARKTGRASNSQHYNYTMMPYNLSLVCADARKYETLLLLSVRTTVVLPLVLWYVIQSEQTAVACGTAPL